MTRDDRPAGIAGAIVAAIALVGEDHLSFGSDFDRAVATRFDESAPAALTQALMDQGLDEPVIAKVTGDTVIRFPEAALPEG